MAIQLGTIAAIGFEEFPPAEWLGCFRELGTSVVQAYRNQDANVTVEEMKDALAAGQMPCDSLHGLYGEQFDPSNPDETKRILAVDAFKREAELVLELGGSLVVIHCASIRAEGVSTEEHDLRIKQLEKSVAELGQFGSSVGVRYAFENLPGYHAIGYDVAELSGLLRRIDAPNTGMCLDVGHANMVSDPAEAIRETGGQMIYVHLSDNSGKSDDHEFPGCGTLDPDQVARAFHEEQYEGTMLLEIFYDVEQLKQLIDEGAAARLARMLQIANGVTTG